MKFLIGVAALLASSSALGSDRVRCIEGIQFPLAGKPSVDVLQTHVSFDNDVAWILIAREGWTVKADEEITLPVKIEADWPVEVIEAYGMEEGVIGLLIASKDLSTLQFSRGVRFTIGDYRMEALSLSNIDWAAFNRCRAPMLEAKAARLEAERMAQPVVDPFKK